MSPIIFACDQMYIAALDLNFDPGEITQPTRYRRACGDDEHTRIYTFGFPIDNSNTSRNVKICTTYKKLSILAIDLVIVTG